MEGADPAEYGEMLDAQFASYVETWQKAGIHVEDWAWESHDCAVSAGYGALIPSIPAEASVAMHGCSDADNVGECVLHMHAVAGTTYQEIAGPVVEQRIAQAGVRVAMMINEAAKGGGASQR